MPQHVRMNWEWELSGLARSLDHSQEPSCCDRRSGLRCEDVRARSLHRSQSPKLWAMQRMNTLDPALGPVDMHAAIPEIDLAPSQGAEFSGSQPMSIGEQDSGCIPLTVAPSLACSFDQAIHLFLCQIFPHSVSRVRQSPWECSVLCGWC